MRTYWSPHHLLHDPGTLPTIEGGSHLVVHEVAARGEIIANALREARFGTLLQPADWGLAPIEAVHAPAFVTLLRTAYERMRQEVHGGDFRPRVVLPETFAVRRPAQTPPRSIWAHLGYHCFDITSPILAETWTAAYWAAQVAVNGAQALLEGEGVAYALCRPPGHHASYDLYGGFCYLNNAAIAAQRLTEAGARVAILDVDFHHGNGTQELFYSRADVCTISLHIDPHHDYPYYWGHGDERGEGVGEGFNLNLPLPLGTDEAGYLDAVATACERLRAFGPDLLLVSLGVDTYAGDPLGGFRLATESFARLGDRLRALNRPALVVQEGGYVLETLGANVVSFLRGMVDA